jgi:hypothetical protein
MDWVSAAAVAPMVEMIVYLRRLAASSTHCVAVLGGRSDVRVADASTLDGEYSSCPVEPPVSDFDTPPVGVGEAEGHRCHAGMCCSTTCMAAVEAVVADTRGLAGEAVD